MTTSKWRQCRRHGIMRISFKSVFLVLRW
jgi:hypothetical protein